VKIILEKAEVLAILGKHFNTVLDDEKVIIRTDPLLEIELRGLMMNETDTPPPPKPVEKISAAAVEEIGDVLLESEQLKLSDRNVLKSVPSDMAEEI